MDEQALTLATFAPFARAGTYVAPGTGAVQPVRCIVDRGVERLTVDSYGTSVIHRADEATFLRDELYPVAGGVLEVGAERWRVGDVLDDDGYAVVVALKRQA